MIINKIKQDLQKLKDPEKAKVLQGFFKTSKGEYGEGDVFLGLTSTQVQEVVKKHQDHVGLIDIQKLLNSKIHEDRMSAVRILVYQYQKATKSNNLKQQLQTYLFYLKNAKKINNWDLVDVSADKIVGDYLLNKKDRQVLYCLAKSSNLWERRIAIVSTYMFIKNNQFNDTLKISEILLYDPHDLIHKAVGWMLREVGKRDQKVEENFLKRYYKTMPRIMLRYAIERFSQEKRAFYLLR